MQLPEHKFHGLQHDVAVNRIGVSCLYLKCKNNTTLEYFKKYLLSNLTIGVREWKHMQHEWDLSFKIVFS